MIKLFVYTKDKTDIILKLNTYISGLISEKFYIDVDWQHGPGVVITIENDHNQPMLAQAVEAFAQDHVKFSGTQDEYEALKRKYQQSQKKLKVIENRVLREQTVCEDAQVMIIDKKSGVYNHQKHEAAFTRYRQQLHPIYMNMLKSYSQLDELDKDRLFITMCLDIASKYEDGIERGYLAFVSQIEGFNSLLKQHNYNRLITEFERYRLRFKNNYHLPSGIRQEYLAWKKMIDSIYCDMDRTFDPEDYQDAIGYFDFEDQVDGFKEKIGTMGNSFHQTLLDYAELDELLHSKKMIVYRNLVNLFFLMLPLFGQGITKRQFYCYVVQKYVESNYDEERLVRYWNA